MPALHPHHSLQENREYEIQDTSGDHCRRTTKTIANTPSPPTIPATTPAIDFGMMSPYLSRNRWVLWRCSINEMTSDQFRSQSESLRTRVGRSNDRVARGGPELELKELVDGEAEEMSDAAVRTHASIVRSCASHVRSTASLVPVSRSIAGGDIRSRRARQESRHITHRTRRRAASGSQRGSASAGYTRALRGAERRHAATHTTPRGQLDRPK